MTSKKFNHLWKDIPKIKQVNSEEGRLYEVNGESAYPSITTVLSKTKDKGPLLRWRKRVGEEHANRVTISATRRGTSMHKLCESYLSNEVLDLSADTTGELLFRSIRPQLDHIDNVRCLETPLFSHILKVAGTVDCIAELDGKLTVIDFKTSTKPKKTEWIEDYFMQGCFYLIAYREITQEMPEQISILISVQDGSIQNFTLTKKDIIHYTNMLKERIEEYYGSIN
jgi:genome maintenance exonuclease 1